MEDIRITLADNLTKLRKKHKLTQVELAHQLGFSDRLFQSGNKEILFLILKQ